MSGHIYQEWLPSAWAYEQYPRQPDVFVIERPRDIGGGMVSLDFKRRVWDSGHQLPRNFPPGVIQRDYSGRNWKRAMVGEACAWLEAAMLPTRAKEVERG